MPTQSEVQYFREKYQGFSYHKLTWSLIIGGLSGIVLAPLDLLKARAQILQEGRVIHGYQQFRGVPSFFMGNEIYDSGSGMRGYWTGFDSIVVKSLVFGASRSFFWCYIYNYFNSDARSKYKLY